MIEEPLVSVVIPVFNGERFFAECIESVLSQTYKKCELVIVNNCSTDNTFQIAEGYAKQDRRIRIENNSHFVGINENWNNAIRHARGRYIYGLSCDDAAPPNYLEVLVQALESHPECDIAHSKLKLIYEDKWSGEDWWPHSSLFARSSEALLDRKHVRLAPFDGLLHLTGGTVYISFSQLMIRRTLFDRVGFLETRWGSVGDFNWYMRATLLANTIHVPDTWGGWRIHPNQATPAHERGSEESRRRADEMIEHALQNYEEYWAGQVRHPLQLELPQAARQIRQFLRGFQSCRSSSGRKAFLVGRLLVGSWVARLYVRSRLFSPDPVPKLIEKWLSGRVAGPILVPL